MYYPVLPCSVVDNLTAVTEGTAFSAVRPAFAPRTRSLDSPKQ